MNSLTRRIAGLLLLMAWNMASSIAGATSPGLQAAYQFPNPLAVNGTLQIARVPVLVHAAGTISVVRVVTQGQGGSDFTAAVGGTCGVGQSFSAGQSCAQPVQFGPKAPGERRGAVVLLDSNGVVLGTQPLYGVGTGGAGVLLPGTMRTVAGNGTWVYKTDGVAATTASIFLPGGVAIDGAGNLFLSDTSNNRVRRIDTTTGLISTVAGTGSPNFGGDNGPGVSAGVNLPGGMLIDGAGDVLFADSGNHAVRRLSLATGVLTTIAGQLGQSGLSGDGGPANAALLNTPEGIALDAAGDLYIADTNNQSIRRVDATTGIITTVAGDGAPGATGDGGPGTAATLMSPWGISLDREGNLYIADLGNNKVRMLSAGGIISTVAGTGNPTYNGDAQAATTANLKGPAAVLVDVAGNLYIADSGNNLIRKVAADTGRISLVAGTGNPVFDGDGGKATEASMYGPYALSLDASGNVFFSDIFHHRIREIENSISILKFLPIQVGRTSLANLVSIENDGNAAMNFSALSPDRNSAIDPGTTTCAISTPLVVGGTCVIGAQFSPQVTGSDVVAEIDLNSDASNTPGVLVLDGEVDALDPTSISLRSSVNPAALGASVTFTASVAGGTSPTGNVRFYDGNTLLGVAPLRGNTATFVTTQLPLGIHPMTANYTGDTANAPSTSAVLNEAIKQQATVTIASNVNPSQVGSSITLTANVIGMSVAPVGSVVFSDGGSAIGNGTINGSGVATFSTGALTAGTHTLTASFAGDTNTLSGSSSPLAQIVNRWATTTSLTSNTASPTVGDAVIFSVHATTTSSVATTGSVQLTDGQVVLATLSLDGQGNASFTTSTLAVGSHDVVARLHSDATNDASTSATLTEIVETITTTTVLASSANPAIAGATLHLTARATPASSNATAGTMVGTMTFIDGSVTLGMANLDGSGMATLDVSNLAVRSHSLVANYSGDANRRASSSPVLTQMVANATTTVQLVSSSNPSIAGRGMTLTAVVSGDGGAPTGTMTFVDGAITLGTAAVNGVGQATLTLASLTAGTHGLTAAYGGDAKDGASTSGVYSQVVQQTTTAISLTSSANPSDAGAAVTFVASLTSNGGLPGGQLVLTDGGTILGSAAMSGTGAASFTLASLTAGTHTLVASYAGDTDHAGSNSGALVQSVQMGTSAVTLAASSNPTLVGNAVAFSVAVTGTANRPGGAVTLIDSAGVLGSIALTAGGTGTLVTSLLGIGDHSIGAVYGGDGTHSGSTSTVLVERVQQSTSISLTSSKNPSIVGDQVVLTANVTGSAGASVSGSVSFVDGGAVLGTVPVNQGGSALATTALSAGTHLIVATYAGDATSQSSASASVSQAVNTAGTSVTLSSSVNPSVTGSPVTFAATVTSLGKVPSGTVKFMEGSQVLGTGTVAQGVAIFTNNSLAAGPHAIVAVYGGDAGTQQSTSAALVQVAQQKTTLGLTSSVNPAQTLQGVVLTATIGNGARATGVVTFSDGATTLSAVAVDASGTASLTLASMSAGTHALAAGYGGDAQNLPSTSIGLTETVQLRSTATSMTTSSDTYLSGQQVTLIAVIRSTGPVAPTGSVTFASASGPLGTAQVSDSGAATLTIYPLANSYKIAATYAGDAVYSSSVSADYGISAGPTTTFSMTPSWTKSSLSSGAHTVVDLTFVSVKGFQDTLALGCLELPANATCTFSTDRMDLKPNGTNVVHLTIDTGDPLGAGALSGVRQPQGWSRGWALATLLPGAGMLALSFGRFRRRMPWLLAGMALCMWSGGLTGCANKLVQGKTPAGSYTVRIQASGTQSGASQTADLTLTVMQ